MVTQPLVLVVALVAAVLACWWMGACNQRITRGTVINVFMGQTVRGALWAVCRPPLLVLLS